MQTHLCPKEVAGQGCQGRAPMSPGPGTSRLPGAEGQPPLEQLGAPSSWLGSSRRWHPCAPTTQTEQVVTRTGLSNPLPTRGFTHGQHTLVPTRPAELPRNGSRGPTIGRSLSAPCPRTPRACPGLQGPRTRHEGRSCSGPPGALPGHVCGGLEGQSGATGSQGMCVCNGPADRGAASPNEGTPASLWPPRVRWPLVVVKRHLIEASVCISPS